MCERKETDHLFGPLFDEEVGVGVLLEARGRRVKGVKKSEVGRGFAAVPAVLDGKGKGLRAEELLVFLLLVVVLKTLVTKRHRGVDGLHKVLRLGHLVDEGIDALSDGLDPLRSLGGILDETLKQLC